MHVCELYWKCVPQLITMEDDVEEFDCIDTRRQYSSLGMETIWNNHWVFCLGGDW